MADLNQVIYSLECCKDIHKAGRMASGCSFCFYRHKGIPECFLSLAADAQELLKEQKHGHWDLVEGYYDDEQHWQCSVCGCEWYLEAGNPDENDMLYCPECGARMDEEVMQE